MNEFRLFAHGEHFDPDAFLASSPLAFDGVWHKGEHCHDQPKTSGVYKVLGNGHELPLTNKNDRNRVSVGKPDCTEGTRPD